MGTVPKAKNTSIRLQLYEAIFGYLRTTYYLCAFLKLSLICTKKLFDFFIQKTQIKNGGSNY